MRQRRGWSQAKLGGLMGWQSAPPCAPPRATAVVGSVVKIDLHIDRLGERAGERLDARIATFSERDETESNPPQHCAFALISASDASAYPGVAS